MYGNNYYSQGLSLARHTVIVCCFLNDKCSKNCTKFHENINNKQSSSNFHGNVFVKLGIPTYLMLYITSSSIDHLKRKKKI